MRCRGRVSQFKNGSTLWTKTVIHTDILFSPHQQNFIWIKMLQITWKMKNGEKFGCLVCIFKSVSEQRSNLDATYVHSLQGLRLVLLYKRVFSPTRTSSLSDWVQYFVVFVQKKNQRQQTGSIIYFFIIDLQYLIWTLQWKLILYDCHLRPSTDCWLFFRFLWLKWKGRRNNYSKKYYVRICM